MKHFSLLLLCALCTLGASAQFSGQGSGTSDDPYQITNADELFEVRNALSASYKLMNDIDLTDWIAENNPTQGWNPIREFSGTFDGNNKTITGLYINRPNNDNIGLFGEAYSAIIKKVYIKAANVTGRNHVGVLVGLYSGGTTALVGLSENVIIASTLKGEYALGGIVGYARNNSKIKNNIVMCPTIEGTDSIGGIVGCNYAEYPYYGVETYASYIENNHVIAGNIKGQSVIGGIMGFSSYIFSKYFDNFTHTFVISNSCSSIISGKTGIGGVCGVLDATSSSKYSYPGSSYSSRKADFESSIQSIYNNAFSGQIYGESNTVGGIVGRFFASIHVASGRTATFEEETFLYLDIYNNVCSGNLFSTDGGSGIVGHLDNSFYFEHQTYSLDISSNSNAFCKNVFCGDTISSQNIGSHVYRISEYNGLLATNNYALSTSNLMVDNETVSVEDNAQHGISYAKKTLMKQSTYEGLGFDFTNDWAIVEGETYPYNINQCRPATIADFKSGISATISGTAIGKSSQCNGSVYVAIGDDFYEGTVTNGQWSVQLDEVKEGQEAKVTGMVDGMMPSILVTAKAEKGTNTPVVDNIPDTDIASLDNTVYINNVEASTGTELTLSVKMKNAVTAEGFGFDLYLPNGVTVAADEDGFPMVELSTERTTARKTNSFDAAFQGDGCLRVLAASTNGSTINGNDGEVCLITINIANDMEEGDYPILLKNIAISDVDAVSHRIEQVKSTLTISAYTPGDANNDGVIDVSDFTATAHYLLGNTPTGFNVKAADANSDGVVDVGDLTAVAHIILYGSVNRPKAMHASNLVNPQ